MIQVIPIINNKGGVGKTTTCVNVAGGLASRGSRVLLVDLDSQGSASLASGVDHGNLRPSVADVLFDDASLDATVRSTSRPNLDLLTGSLDLANANVRLKGKKQSAWYLKQALDPAREDYDVILVDCAPSTSVLTVNALVAADAFIIPLNPSYLALEGVVSLGKVVRRVRQGVGDAAPVLGLVITMIDPDDSNNDVVSEVRRHYGGKVFDTLIRRHPALEEAPGEGRDIFAYAPDSPGAEDYAHLVEEIEDRIERYGIIYDRVTRQPKG
jgi:chromosome partitioning protein